MNDEIFGVAKEKFEYYERRAGEIVFRHRQFMSTGEMERMLAEELERLRSFNEVLPPGRPVLIATSKWSLSTVVWDTPAINPRPLPEGEHLGAMVVRVRGPGGAIAGDFQCDLWGCGKCEIIATSCGPQMNGGPLQEILTDIAACAKPSEFFEKMPMALAAAARMATIRFGN